MKYIVTGGAGFIGSHIVDELVYRQHEVVVVDNLFSGTLKNIRQLVDEKNVSFVAGSITDRPALARAFESADGIFHEAAIASVPVPWRNPRIPMT